MESKKVTIHDIARSANVSKSTVSRVLNDSTPVNDVKRKAVLAAMKRLNFQPNVFARGLAGGQSFTIGILTQNIGSPFYDAVTQGITQHLTGTNYSPIFVDGQWQRDAGAAGIKTLLGRQVDGLIVVGGNIPEFEFVKLKSRTPLIVVARQMSQLENHCVYIDNFKAAYMATKYLIDAGHTKIAHITGIPDHQDAIRRYKGYSSALEDAGLTLDEDLVFEGNFDGQSGVMAIEGFLMRKKSYTAIFCANDVTAFGARLGLHRRGMRVPEDVSIVGFDDQAESAFVTPPLTTVHQPAEEMGVSAARAMLNMLKNEEFELPEFEAKLIVRESVTRQR